MDSSSAPVSGKPETPPDLAVPTIASRLAGGDERDRLLHALTEAAPDAVMLMDAAGRIVTWNAAATRIFGYSADAAIGADLHRLLAPERYRLKAMECIPRWAATGEGEAIGRNIEVVGRHRDGSEVDIELSLSSVFMHGQWHAIGIARDISARKRQERLLADSEERFRATFEQAAVGLAMVAPDGRWLRVNRRLCEIVGYTRDELLAGRFQDVTHPDDLSRDFDNARRMLAREVDACTLDKRYLHKDGHVVWVHLTVAPTWNDDGTPRYFISVVEDISRRKAVEDALARSEAVFRSYFETAMVGMALSAPDKRWLKVNPAMCEMLGYSAEELCRLRWPQLTHRGDLEANLASFRRLIDGEVDGYRVEKRFIRKDGRAIDVLVAVKAIRQASGEIDSIVTMVEDISERKRAESALRDSETRLRLIAANTSAFIYELGPDGRVRYVNRPDENLAAGVAIGAPLVDAFPMALHETLTAHLARAVASRREVEIEYELAAADGNAHAYFARLTPVLIGERIGSVIFTANDISERRGAEKEIDKRLVELTALNHQLAEAQGQLLQSEKLASLGQLAAGVAHEINNPVGFVTSNLGALESYLQAIFAIVDIYDGVDPAHGAAFPEFEQARLLRAEHDFDYIRKDIFDLLAESKDGLGRVRKIVQDLKDFSRVGDQAWQLADVHQCLDSTLNIVWNELKYKAQVVKDYAAALPPIHCLPSQLNQVFMNLLVNAAQAIEVRGVITLRTGHSGDEVWVEVEDTGKGIPREHLNRIFEPFFTTKPVGKGTGLGLSLVHGIVTRHHGRVDLKSEVGSGTCFRVVLPIGGPADGAP